MFNDESKELPEEIILLMLGVSGFEQPPFSACGSARDTSSQRARGNVS
jgi:hypothetical protein